MSHLAFTHNPNGKLFLEIFTCVQIHDPSVFFLDAEFEIIYKGVSFGHAKVVAIRQLQFRMISDVLAYLEHGKPAALYAKQLATTMGEHGKLEPDQCLDHIALQYTSLNLKEVAIEMREWWEERNRDVAPVLIGIEI